MLLVQPSRRSLDAVRVLIMSMKRTRLGKKQMGIIRLDKRRVFLPTLCESGGVAEVPPREGVGEMAFRKTAV